ncbi:MAG TPA: SDR family NAD(P)-dependent oxidoreductase [Aldersonia sp.]
MSSTYFRGKVAVITGAGSGIGRALSLELARSGAVLALSDVDMVGLAATERLATVEGAVVHTRSLDVTDRGAVLAYADEVAADLGKVNLVFNNAGIGVLGSVADLSFDQFQRVIDVDLMGVVHGTKAFLPHLVASGDGHVVNLSSMFGFVGIANQSPYNAAKFAVRGFTEALRQEMLGTGTPVAVTCVHPGGIKTNIARNSAIAGVEAVEVNNKFEETFFRMTAERAAQIILKGVRKRKARVHVGMDAVAMDLLSRVAGPHYQRVTMLMTRLMPEPTLPAARSQAAEHRKVS